MHAGSAPGASPPQLAQKSNMCHVASACMHESVASAPKQDCPVADHVRKPLLQTAGALTDSGRWSTVTACWAPPHTQMRQLRSSSHTTGASKMEDGVATGQHRGASLGSTFCSLPVVDVLPQSGSTLCISPSYASSAAEVIGASDVEESDLGTEVALEKQQPAGEKQRPSGEKQQLACSLARRLHD
jgi:hypothetical protein